MGGGEGRRGDDEGETGVAMAIFDKESETGLLYWGLFTRRGARD